MKSFSKASLGLKTKANGLLLDGDQTHAKGISDGIKSVLLIGVALCVQSLCQ